MLPAKSVGEAFESVSAKYFKEAELWVKTKLPVAVVVTDNSIPKDEFRVEKVDRRRRDESELPSDASTSAPAPAASAATEPVVDDEALLEQAFSVLKATRRASTSTLQRRLRIGYNRAARLLEDMERRGIVGPENGSTPREILVDVDTYTLRPTAEAAREEAQAVT